MKKKFKYLLLCSGVVVVVTVGLAVPISIVLNNNINNGYDDNKPLEKGWTYKTNTTSDEVLQFDIEHNKKLHFNYPVYKGNKVSLKADGSPSFNYPGQGITPGNPSKEDIIPTDKHAQLAKQVYSVNFKNGADIGGTAWILDYKLTNDGSYPLTWYFGTNAHVLDDLKVKDDKLYPEKFGNWNPINKRFNATNTEGISLLQIRNPEGNKEYPDSLQGLSNDIWKQTTIYFRNENPDNGEQLVNGLWSGYYKDNPPVKTIFTGNDFLTISPSDSSINSFSTKEECADFGVFELTFESEQQARETTNNYAEWNEDLKFKYYQEDLLKNPSLQTDHVYEIGFPEDSNDGGMSIRRVSANMNAKDDTIDNYTNKGLSTSQHYNSFNRDKKGIYDGMIAMPWFGYVYDWVDNNDLNNPLRTTSFSTYGLIYGVNNGCMRPGSSGGLTIDDNGYALGIHFSSDYNAATGSSQAFYSSGFDYKGYYGNHNIPQYDLIRGGYPKQKNSYYDGLVGWYGKDVNFKTRLFPNGLTSRN